MYDKKVKKEFQIEQERYLITLNEPAARRLARGDRELEDLIKALIFDVHQNKLSNRSLMK